jgi:hypothetical protein
VTCYSGMHHGGTRPWHAGTAAAGLTLTQADLVVLLEPFLSPGDEAQAANRVHRIGQTRPVRCVTYYVEAWLLSGLSVVPLQYLVIP